MISVPFRSPRADRAQFAQKLQHAVPSVVLLAQGIERLRAPWHLEDVLLGGAEIVVSALVIGSMVLLVRRIRAHRASGHAPHAHTVDWVDLFLAGMFAVEALAHQRETGHIPRPTVLLATVMLTLGFFHSHVARLAERRRALRVSDDRISIGGRPFRRLTLAWREVASIDVDGDRVRVSALDGRTREFSLVDAVDEPKAREALSLAQTHLEAQRARESDMLGRR